MKRRMCMEMPATIRTKLQGLLEECVDLFPKQLPKGRPPKRTVEFEIKIEERAILLNKSPYKLRPKEHKELQAQLMIC